MGQRYLAIVNPAAGGGSGANCLPPRSTACGLAESKWRSPQPRSAGQATEIAREAYARGLRNFIAVGGDGTSYEIVNGLFPQALGGERPTLAFLPLGTGNSFLRDFSDAASSTPSNPSWRAAAVRATSCACAIAAA